MIAKGELFEGGASRLSGKREGDGGVNTVEVYYICMKNSIIKSIRNY
jgi:hypothetical protein